MYQPMEANMAVAWKNHRKNINSRKQETVGFPAMSTTFGVSYLYIALFSHLTQRNCNHGCEMWNIWASTSFCADGSSPQRVGTPCDDRCFIFFMF